MSEAQEYRLLNTPLQHLTDHDFGQIMEACNTLPMGHNSYFYFLPRILELMTIETQDFSFPFVEYIYRSLAKFDYPNQLEDLERSAINHFFYALLAKEFALPLDEIDEALLFDLAEVGYDAQPFLATLYHRQDWQALKKICLAYIVFQESQDTPAVYAGWRKKGTRQALIDYLNRP